MRILQFQCVPCCQQPRTITPVRCTSGGGVCCSFLQNACFQIQHLCGCWSAIASRLALTLVLRCSQNPCSRWRP
ncbi:hypothetical protein OU5_0570 [Pseudomonas mandelii JR-1]|uniref:Uncharacterized protein n=1 Tax=Pseudomonas mandelii JR-1 TaxID=1147786 RepID=A0A024E3Y5_9PSED|nr:hypothetical protein OU5_0570 [Pseudomonas mandelii JR-1]